MKRPAKYHPLLSRLQTKGYLCADLMDAIQLFNESNHVRGFFTKLRGHYSPRGNQFVAKQVLGFLEQNELTTRQEIKPTIKKLTATNRLASKVLVGIGLSWLLTRLRESVRQRQLYVQIRSRQKDPLDLTQGITVRLFSPNPQAPRHPAPLLSR